MWHGFSWKFHINFCHNLTRLGASLVQIHTEFHDYSMSFIQVLFVLHAQTWHGFYILGKFKSWNFHDICQENDGISIGFCLILDQTEKVWKNPCHIFYRAHFTKCLFVFCFLMADATLTVNIEDFVLHWNQRTSDAEREFEKRQVTTTVINLTWQSFSYNFNSWNVWRGKYLECLS